jgi:hypothetical protein
VGPAASFCVVGRSSWLIYFQELRDEVEQRLPVVDAEDELAWFSALLQLRYPQVDRVLVVLYKYDALTAVGDPFGDFGPRGRVEQSRH